jgi:hypothetical protein
MTKPRPKAKAKAPAKPKALPAGPWIVRIPSAHGEPQCNITDAGLVAARVIAASGGSQKLIAAELGISLTALKALMQRDERVRLAYEAGLAEEEMILVRGLREAAAAGAWVPALFLLKTRHNYIEGAAPPSTAPNIIITLPDARSPQDYLRIINETPPALAAPIERADS